ncbi:hypothetical protein [Kribbella ginsengisoli]|uniref:Bulb-type lectin domain-containing protein n=1 Tax=Kribbella ginsengisoli TaxID=363865 RepID=A0ABP6XXZ9_9ACTN
MIKNKLRATAALAASAAALIAGTAVLAVAPANAATTSSASVSYVSDTLKAGQSLKAGQYIRSNDGKYVFKMDAQGWASLSRGPGYNATWTTPVSKPGAVLRLQTDGNLVLIYGRTTIWKLGTSAPNANLILHNDGVLSLYNAKGVAIWNHHMILGRMGQLEALRTDNVMVSPNHVYSLKMQKTGDLQLLKSGKTVLWHSNTAGHPGSYALVQGGDLGGFAVLSSGKQTLWSAKATSHDAVLTLSNTGALSLIWGRTTVWTAK